MVDLVGFDEAMIKVIAKVNDFVYDQDEQREYEIAAPLLLV